MDHERANCLPHPKAVEFKATPAEVKPLLTHWSNCVPNPFIEELLSPIKQIPGGLLTIRIEPRDETHQTDEHYTLDATDSGLLLSAASPNGLIYGAVTLAQLHHSGDLVRFTRIADGPRFSWRGLLIDPARHFLSVALLKRIIDGMARLKMNILHLHLTDDQGFRFESFAHPKLHSPEHYTQKELSALIEYAGERGIQVIPELDVPGHVTSWLQAYPEWGPRHASPTKRFGVHQACLNPIDEQVFEALQTLFEEVASVFSSRYVHIGGDEVHPAWWTKDPAISAFMAEAGLDLASLQNRFTTRIVSMLAKMGKTAIGWDEVLHEDMPNMIVQNWRGMTTRDRIAAQGLPCIVSAPFYLDLHYPADMHYAFDIAAEQREAIAQEDAIRQDPRLGHVKEGIEWTLQWRDRAITYDQTADVLGGEACLWSELVDEHTLETRLWSRLPAVAERLWTQEPHPDFNTRLDTLLDSPPFLLLQRQRTALHTLGLEPAQIDIALLLEPVKWYARLLGSEALSARISGREMPQARPYQTDTPLNRVVDMLSPESRSAAALRDASEATWFALANELAKQDSARWPADMKPAVEAFKQFAEVIQSGDRTSASSLYGPHGEYMIAAVPAWLDQS